MKCLTLLIGLIPSFLYQRDKMMEFFLSPIDLIGITISTYSLLYGCLTPTNQLEGKKNKTGYFCQSGKNRDWKMKPIFQRKKATGGLWNNRKYQDGGWSREKPSHEQNLGIFSPTCHLLGRGGLEIKLIYIMKLPKNTKVQASESFWIDGHIHVLGNWCIPAWGQKVLLLDSSGPCWKNLIWLFICILYYMLYNNLVNVSNCFPEFCDTF